MGTALLFYLFASVLIASSAGVILGRNPVHSVLFLIMAFFNAAGLFLLAGAEFLAFTLIIVYVGAVAVLFLFVVMMLDIDFKELRAGMARHAPMALILGIILMAELIYLAINWAPHTAGVSNPSHPMKGHNTQALGQLIYTDYFLIFQLSGLVLLVAMIGAIVLTLRHRSGVKRQNICQQIDRSPANTLELKKVQFRQGVKIP